MDHSNKKIRVLIIDDSALMRQLISQILNSTEDIEVIATAVDPYDAREKIKQYKPDVLTLDIEMPKMNGLVFLRNLMRLNPLPVLMVSAFTEAGAEATLDALALGAVDYIGKPKLGPDTSLEDYANEITDKIRNAAHAHLNTHHPIQKPDIKKSSAHEYLTKKVKSQNQIIAIGASTGGTEAIKEILLCFNTFMPPIVIAQHLPESFTAAFAKRLNKLNTTLHVQEATNHLALKPNHVYIAPGDKHLKIHHRGVHYECELNDDEPINDHKPSVDVLFESIAKAAGHKAIGVILTGMGQDGANGMRLLHDANAATIAQDEASSIIWGMPNAAIQTGGVDHILPLEHIGMRLNELTTTPKLNHFKGQHIHSHELCHI